MRDIFVLGLDPRNLETLREVEGMDDLRFHPLLSVAELLEADQLPMATLLDKADQQLRNFGDPIDAIVGYWDFPVSSMVPILCERFGLRSATLESVLKCEHKYWSRLEQSAVIDEYPPFALVDLDDDSSALPDIGYPLWIKPVKAFSSELAFRVADEQELTTAIDRIAEGIGRVSEPFDFVLEYAQLPPEIAKVGGHACLAERAVQGQQVTVEGYRTRSGVHIYGIVDSYNYPNTSSFQRYQYPSQLPEQTQHRLADISRRVIEQIGLDSVAFNIEYFWNPDTGAINLLEINPRHSQSHATLFNDVDGVPNHQCMVQLALGLDPALPYRKGPYGAAAKWFVRRFTNGVVRRSPTADEVAQVENSVSGCSVDVLAGEGQQLSELPEQDSYSYAYAAVQVGARAEHELEDKYDNCLSALPFEFDDLPDTDGRESPDSRKEPASDA